MKLCLLYRENVFTNKILILSIIFHDFRFHFVMLLLAGSGKRSKCSLQKFEMAVESGAEFVALMNAPFKVLERMILKVYRLSNL